MPDSITRVPLLRTTRWSLIRRAIDRPEALNTWAGTCWYPLYTWARHKGWNPDDAADSVQAFLGKICTSGTLAQADPARGRFRSWLLTGFQNHLTDRIKRSRRLKRGGDTPHIHLDPIRAEECYLTEVATISDPGEACDRAWALALMDEAMQRLERHYRDGGRGRLIEVLLPALEEALPDGGYGEAAEVLEMSEGAIRQAVVRMRSRYRLCLLEVAGEWLGVTCGVQLEEKLRELLGES